MVFDATPLTPTILDAVAANWSIVGSSGGRLYGGEESAAYRVGEHVVRIGPAWRSDEELEWAHSVASSVAERLPEAVAPLASASGASVVRVDGRPVSVWRYRRGSWPDDDADLLGGAAELLARVHRALRSHPVVARPGPGASYGVAPEVEDVDLDRWLLQFDGRYTQRQVLHGDFYSGNVLVDDGRIVAVLDWDEAFVGPPERELAWAAWEWSDGYDSFDLEEAFEFIDTYVSADGVAGRIDEVMLRQLVRERIRREVCYARAARDRGVPHDADDYEYEARQLEAFQVLRP